MTMGSNKITLFNKAYKEDGTRILDILLCEHVRCVCESDVWWARGVARRGCAGGGSRFWLHLLFHKAGEDKGAV
ncbi:Hypothetical predicted protein [Marmota monax]|uniref:Uncharacterized protein n=1 Tax=Marmota monax TaxID=9995 RepID=A0A5E4B0B8_MARMO|nr:hypothetical protein GHT09_017558 [Marmota monax]VTJ62219.1 Hypothetical predicted protein [Marmota monax]